MFDAPVDAWYVWVALSLVAATVAGTVAEFPTAPPPDAHVAASTVDRVAAADYDATARHPVDADAVKLEPATLSFRDDGRVTHARLASRVTPVRPGTALWRILRGARPGDLFESVANLRRAASEARDRPAQWERTDQLLVRTVTWRDVHVTLVGA